MFALSWLAIGLFTSTPVPAQPVRSAVTPSPALQRGRQDPAPALTPGAGGTIEAQAGITSLGCARTVLDQATAICIQASSVPGLGQLYPLSLALNVDGSGRVGMGTTSPIAGLHVNADDGILATGTFGVGSLPIGGPGTRMLWHPRKAAFRAGEVNSVVWNDAFIGDHSFAAGFSTRASGNYSVALGNEPVALGESSTSLGDGTTAAGASSTALGFSTQANGESSTAIGRTTIANGFASVSMGEATTAGGSQSVAMGLATLADSSVSTAMGRYNVGGGDPLNWVDTDPLFEVGIGTGLAARSNAMTILKSGNVGIGTANPRNPLHIAAAGTDSGGILGSPQVVARLRQSTPGQASAIAIDALGGQDSILYLSEAGAAVWDLRNKSASSDDLTIN
ncbi:MAG: hypothetical protein ACKVXR_18465, partial [Planctomycetota bacterium]